ncbi:MAG: hypothetical protein GY856_08545 [bacterium]|nr:hypothetical protein [bacterium]
MTPSNQDPRSPRHRRPLSLLTALGAVLLLVSVLPASGGAQTVALSEIRIDQPSTDNDEYFELAGTPGEALDALTYLVIGDGSAGSGVVEAVVDPSGLTIPASGYFVAAEGTFTLGTADLFTSLNFENSDNVTHLLVRDFSGANGEDLDTDDDGTLDTTPWSELVDCLALVESVGSGEQIYCPTTLGPDSFYVPAHSFHCPAGWQIGIFDPGTGVDTPGAANTCEPIVEVELSEIRIDQPSTDDDEFFELAGTPDAALDGFTYLVIGDGSGGSGVIEAVVDLAGQTMPTTGFFVAAESTFTLGIADLVSTLNFENSDNVTHLLVRDFTGANGDDLDTDDDGTLDTTPWSELVDCLALVETVGSGEQIYCATTLGPDGSYVPAHSFSCPAGWQIGAYDPGDALNTPGAANACPTAELVVNEIDYDQPSSDWAEFVEIKNTGSAAVNLDAYALTLVNGSGGGASVYQTVNLPDFALAPGEYYVVCSDATAVANCDLDVISSVQNGAPDAVAITIGETIVDTVSYEGDSGAPYTEGSGAGLGDLGTGGAGGPNEYKGISRWPDGVDTDQNNVDLSTRCVTPGEANVADDSDCAPREPPQLVINEIDYDQPSSDFAEFVEIKNVGGDSADLDGVVLELINGYGGGASVYKTVALPAVVLDPGEYYVVCSNAVTVFNCDLEALSSIQNGAPDAVALLFEGAILDTVSYQGDTGAPYTEGSGAGLKDSGATGEDYKGISRLPDGYDSDQNAADFAAVCITPGGGNTSTSTDCGRYGPVREIFEIQGSGLNSPYAGEMVTTIDNVVTAVGIDGFFMQTPAARSDGVLDTSDGVYVFTGVPAVGVGDLVEVGARVVEFYDFTELSGAVVTVTAAGGGILPAPVVFDATTPSPDPEAPSCSIEYECYEGMLIEITGGTVAGSNLRFSVDPVAEIAVVAGGERAFREKGIEYPGLAGLPVWDGNPEVFELDPDRLGLPNEIVPAGSTFDAVGALGYEYGDYELWPSAFSFTPAPLPQPVRASEPGELTIGSLNLWRLFDHIPDGGETVVSEAEYLRRLSKFSLYIREVLGSPDILGVQEVEKLGVLEDLAAVIYAADEEVVYSAYLIDGNDFSGIDVGFLVRDTVEVAALTQLEADVPFGSWYLHDRPPLLVEGSYIDPDGGAFPVAVMVNHTRSRVGIDDPSSGDFVREKRLTQAQSIAQLAQDFQTAHPSLPLILIGDYNAFEFTDGYVDLIGQIRGDFDPAENLLSGPDLVDPDLTGQVLAIAPEERYSYNYAGNAQVLDHALSTTAADPWVRGLEYGRGNADAAVNLIEDDTTPLRSADHDGLVLYLMSDGDGDGVPYDEDVCPGTVIPESVPTVRLGVRHWALVDDDTVFDTTLPPGCPSGASCADEYFTVEHTAGCSCEQIIDALDLGKGHEKFGCSLGAMSLWVGLVQL